MMREETPMKKLVILGIIGGITWGLAWSILAPYLRSLGYSGTEYGLMGSTAIISGALSTILGGTLSDKIGARRVVATGTIIQSLAIILISTGQKTTVAAGFFLNGAANGFTFTSMQALIARVGSDEKLHYTFSYVMAANTLGGAIGSFAGWIPVLVAGDGMSLVEAYRTTLRFASALPLLSIPIVLSLPEILGGPTGRRGFLGVTRRLDSRILKISVANIIIGFGAALSIHNIDYYFAAKYGVTSAQLGSVLGLQQLFMAALMTRMPSLADRVGGVLRLYLAVSYSSIPLLILMTLTSNFYLAAGLYLARSILMNVANPLFNAFVMRLVPREIRGSVSALLSLSWTLPAGGGRAVGGYLLDLNLELPLRLTALLYTMALTYIAALFPEELKRERRCSQVAVGEPTPCNPTAHSTGTVESTNQ